ncbi:Putative glycoside hydrolase family 16, concanavalin A-like lectin/glucanase domain superfamily [Septoria linicola]|uniref:Glycoside hydrolase family 16, concanavalin A-like lectin/glucanase domain superfamily n=1 Tax=Septoria linicola TaxID=215465 RepID=A0A9Q9AUQ6_9PEZI|nr:putative glycoside hydrolase family 16, concanavalin A-like lectin/glucanase domain superfamily [Septoria linicola]USW51056.1 Putative glycoside hydrolase family 16, concanavalin A-like lectin/glucanase domain superfamily [Septoria linicola]
MKTSALTLAFAASTAFASAPSPGTSWKKTLFLDDFNGGSGSAPDSSKWITQTGTSYPGGPPAWGTFEVETYTSSGNNVRQAGNGDLWIIPRKSSSGKWTSARLETRQSNFKAPAGGKLRVETRIKMPNVSGASAAGYWPAFWALGGAFRGNYQNWPGVGELDIMENVNGQDTVSNVIHCDVNPGGICNESDGLGGTYSCSGSRCPGNYHIYEMVIDRSVSPERITFYVDRRAVRRVTATQLGSVWNKTVNSGFYLILNVAMGGAYPDAVAGFKTPTTSTVSGREMAVDYVAVWST